MLRILAMNDVPSLCRRARAASRLLAPHDRASKDAALRLVAEGLRARTAEIVSASAQDVEEARARGTSGALLDRLALDAGRVEQMADAVEQVATLDDPVGQVLSDATRPNGIRVRRVRVPLGVVAMIYEARPNVTAEASALCLKAGNAVVLRGGSEAARSNAAIVAVVADALETARLPRDAVQMVPPGDRDAVRELVQQADTVDLVIPRGGEALIRSCARTRACRSSRTRAASATSSSTPARTWRWRPASRSTASSSGRASATRSSACSSTPRDAARLLPPIARALLDGGCELRG